MSTDHPERLVGLRLDRSIPQIDLNIEEKVRSNLFPWNGQFSPQLISVLLSTYAGQNDFVLDPFLGSGTVLLEAGAHGLPVFGGDINPAPFKIARTYHFINVAIQKRRLVLDAVESLLHGALPDLLPFMSDTKSMRESEIKSELVRLAAYQDDLAKVLLDALIVLLDFHKPGLDIDRVFSVWRRLRERVFDLPYSREKVRAENCDARDLPLRDNCVDLVLTSPPYINVFNYHQQYRASVEALGWRLLEVAKAEIGSNRKHRSNRYLTVVQYCLDITDCLHEVSRVGREGARMIWIIGRESNVRKTPFYNGDILLRLSSCCPRTEPEYRQERVFLNRFGKDIYEDIIHFRFRKRTGRLGLCRPTGDRS